MDQVKNYNNIDKKMNVTMKTRFHASRRLKLHSKLSTYSIVIISLSLILISLLQTYNIGNNIEHKIAGLIQIFSAIAVLVYSLLIDKNNYSSLSEKMYSSASRIGELKQELHPFLNEEYNIEKYTEFKNKYYDILKLYETHSINDFRGDFLRAKLEVPKYYNFNFFEKVLCFIKVFFLYSINFISYLVVMGILFYVIYFLIFGNKIIS